MSKDGLVSALVNHVDGQTVARLHQRIQILASMVHLHPARVVARVRSLLAVEQSQLTGLGILLVCPDFVGREIGGVKVSLRGVKDHAVDARLGVIFVVLHILIKLAVLGDREDVTVTSVIVEWIAVDVVGGLVGSQNEDGAGISVGVGSES